MNLILRILYFLIGAGSLFYVASVFYRVHDWEVEMIKAGKTRIYGAFLVPCACLLFMMGTMFVMLGLFGM